MKTNTIAMIHPQLTAADLERVVGGVKGDELTPGDKQKVCEGFKALGPIHERGMVAWANAVGSQGSVLHPTEQVRAAKLVGETGELSNGYRQDALAWCGE